MNANKKLNEFIECYHIHGQDVIREWVGSTGEKGSLPADIESDLRAIVAEVGFDRLQQVLGMNGQLTVDLVIRKELTEDQQSRYESIHNQLSEMWDDGLIAWVDEIESPQKVHSDHPFSTAIRNFQQWATRRGLTLKQYFNSTSQASRIPPVALVVTDGLGRSYIYSKSVPDTLKAVVPHADGNDVLTVEKYLERLSTDKGEVLAGGLDRKVSGPTPPTPKHTDEHEAIKGMICERPEIIGEEWEQVDTEYPVGNPDSDDRGRPDILFQHKSHDKWMLVEIKSRADDVANGIGQVLQYKHRLLMDRPELTKAKIEMSVAAPEYRESHREAARETGIHLIDESSINSIC